MKHIDDRIEGWFDFDVLYGNIVYHACDNSLNPIRKKSTEAAKLYEDNSLDFVFIDAAHDYENVKADITSWYPKIKIGGVIAGHDYYESWPEVKMAVNEFFKDSIFYPFSKSWVHRKC